MAGTTGAVGISSVVVYCCGEEQFDSSQRIHSFFASKSNSDRKTSFLNNI